MWQGKAMSATFLADNKITARNNDGLTQYNSREISAVLKTMKKRDTFCVLGITNQDLYPCEEYNFVFGEANLDNAVGVFSFCRFHPDFPGNQDCS